MKKLATSSNCFVCGRENDFGLHLNFYRTDSGEVQAVTRVSDQYQGYPGIVHGGIIAAMLDEISGRAILMDEPGQPTRFLVTASLNIRYRKPVPTDTELHLKGRLISDNGRVAKVTGAIHDQSGQLLAEADGVMVDIPQHLLEGAEPERLGWRVELDEEDNA